MTQPQKTRISLILRVANENDIQAWEQFIEIYQPLVYRIGISRGLQSADAHDLVQEVMTRVARSISTWDPDPDRGSFRGWISRIARNLIVDFIRHQNRLPKTSGRSEIQRLLEQTPDEAEETGFLDLEVEKQIFAWAAEHVKPQFKENTWTAFWQTAVKQIPVEQVATELGISAGAVYIARSRVMAKLKMVVQSQQEFRG